MSRIVFITSQKITGSTVIGRILPLARGLSGSHEVHVCVMEGDSESIPGLQIHAIGKEPFTRTSKGKIRLSGIPLVTRLVTNSILTGKAVRSLDADIIIIAKPLPHTVLAAFLATVGTKKFIVVDSDDFELTANRLTSLWQRAAVHWAEHLAARLASACTAATPFLVDIWEQLTGGKKPVVLIPTGLSIAPSPTDGPARILYVGSLSKSSGHRVDMLPSIVAKVREKFPTVAVTITGDGDDENQLEEEFKKRNLTNISFTGRFDASAVDSYLTKGTIIIDPIDSSLTNRAKSSYRAMVAVASGLPVVTSNIGIRSYLIPEKFHQRAFAQAENIQSYAEKIVGFLEHPLSLEEKAELIRHSKQYMWDELVKKFKTVISPAL